MPKFDEVPETKAFLAQVRSPLVRAEIRAWVERGFTGKVRCVFPQVQSKPIDHITTVEMSMRIYRHKPILSNDAPRGGKCGWYAESGGEDVSWWAARLTADRKQV